MKANRRQEIGRYLFFAVLTALVNIGSFSLYVPVLGLGLLLGNTLAFATTVVFAYFTFKLFVFKGRDWGPVSLLKEFSAFLGTRIFSFLVDMGMMSVFVTLLSVDKSGIKILSNLVIIIGNYFLNKYWIFRKKEETGG